MKIIVTGGAGFIGSCLIWKLNQEGYNDIVVVDHLQASEKWRNLVGKRFEDYLEKDAFLAQVQQGKSMKCDMIVHMGACSATTETDASFLMENNYAYSKALACWAVKRDIPFLYASSAATYGDGRLGYNDDDVVTPTLRPLNIYGYSKHLFDLWVIRHKLANKVTGFKFFNVFGPNEYHKGDMRSVVVKAYATVKKEGKIRLFKSYKQGYADGEQMRDFIYIKDAVAMVCYFIEHPSKHGIFNIGTGKARTWNALAESLSVAMKIPIAVEYIDMPEALRDKYQYFTQAETGKLKKAGCPRPATSLEAAVKDYVKYLDGNAYL